ncbi:MAG: molybdopterin-dependent oxidoreductase [Steroidobacteraceae bacterium]
MNMTKRPSATRKGEIFEDVTIPSVCEICICQCPIVVRRVNGVVVKVEGNPDSEKYRGVVCGKGVSAPMFQDDSNRLNYPLMRTNPKGHGVDPGWKRISWDEALKLACGKLGKVVEEDPRKLVVYVGVTPFFSVNHAVNGFAGATGCRTVLSGASVHCGNSEHFFGFSRQSMSDNADWQYTNFVIQAGINMGAGASYRTRITEVRQADARVRGMKLVMVDPVGAVGTEVADEWVPLVPGTDGALFMAMAHVLVHELDVVDREYLLAETNLPYLIGEDGLYVRGADGKPLMYDLADGLAKPFDATFGSIALEGSYVVDGRTCRTAYDLLKGSLRDWTPERAAKATEVPAERIRRLTRELADAAQVGATTVIDGHTLRYRPAAIIGGRGIIAHDNAYGTWLALMTVGELLGLPGAVGGIVYAGAVSEGYKPGHYSWDVEQGPDGIQSGYFYQGPWRSPIAGYPIAEPARPDSIGLRDLNPLPLISPLAFRAICNPKQFGLDFDTEGTFFLAIGGNWVYNHNSPDVHLEAMKKCFVVSIQNYLNDSVNAAADIVLPGTTHLERLSIPQSYAHQYQQMGYPGTWECYLRQPVIAPAYERRDESEVLIDLLAGIGRRGAFNQAMNAVMVLKEPWVIKSDEVDVSWADLVDRYCRSHWGADKGLDWFKKHGVVKWPSKIEEWYWSQFRKAGRQIVYYEPVVRNGKLTAKLVRQLDIDYPVMEWPGLPYWEPCAQCRESNEEFDMAAVYYKHALAAQSYGQANLLLKDALEKDVVIDVALINAETARKKGIRDGDEILIEARDGHSIRHRARLSQTIHPRVIGVCNGLINDSEFTRAAKGKKFNWLLSDEWEYVDKIVQAIEADRAVRVRRAGVRT